MAKAQPERRSIAPVRVLRTLVAQESSARDESDRKFRHRCRFFSFEPLFRSHRQDRHLSCEVMNDSSLGQLILFIGGGSRAPSRDANFGAKGALFFDLEQGTTRSIVLSPHKKHEE